MSTADVRGSKCERRSKIDSRTKSTRELPHGLGTHPLGLFLARCSLQSELSPVGVPRDNIPPVSREYTVSCDLGPQCVTLLKINTPDFVPPSLSISSMISN